MKCLIKCSVPITFFTLTFQVVFADPLLSYDNERVQSHVIDPNDNDTNFGQGIDKTDHVVSEVLNINDSSTSSVLSNFNLTRESLLNRLNQSGRLFRPRNNTEVEYENPENGNIDHTFQIEHTKNLIRDIIQSAVNRNTSHIQPDPNAAIHEIAFYPVCSKNDENSWLAENTAKLYFSSSLFLKLQPDIYLHKAELRLFQKNPDNTLQSPQCTTDVDEIIRVTISVMVKRDIKGEMKYKKRFCESFTTSKRKTAWVAVDIGQVIRQWVKAYYSNSSNSRAQISNPMLMIDVEDEDKNQLKAGTFFESTDCQAATAIPWAYYREIRDSSGRIEMQAPHYPRIDMVYSRRQKLTQSHYNYPLYHHHHLQQSQQHHQQHHQQLHHRNHNRSENVRQLYELSGAAGSDSSTHHNFRYLSETQRNHRKRHIHHKHQVQPNRNEEFFTDK